MYFAVSPSVRDIHRYKSTGTMSHDSLILKRPAADIDKQYLPVLGLTSQREPSLCHQSLACCATRIA